MRWFLYEPETPCRPHVYGESIFVEQWKATMRQPVQFGDGEPNEKFCTIVTPWTPIADDAVAASSFVCWLGTNIGRCFLDRGEKLAREHGLKLSQGYALAWAEQDRRSPGMNHDRRTMQAILSEDRITTRSVEIVGMVVWWLGEPDGQEMIRAARAEIEMTSKAILEHNMAVMRAERRAFELGGKGL